MRVMSFESTPMVDVDTVGFDYVRMYTYVCLEYIGCSNIYSQHFLRKCNIHMYILYKI